MDILASTQGYEAFLRGELGREVVEEGLAVKRKEMRAGPFPFLRATYWRWAETVLELVPKLASAPQVLAVGDIHLENFGTWRDADGRLVWGVNDYDEAAEMPYVLDLLRLAASGLLAGSQHKAEFITDALLGGYARGLEEPGPALLDRKLAWLRETVMVPEGHRQEFWDKLKKKRKKYEARREDERPRLWPRYEATLRAALPPGSGEPSFWYRTAGLGSLGRPRWVAQAHWCGDWVIREAKGVIPSAWTRVHAGSGRAIRCIEIATGRYRAPDPWYRVVDGVAVRRLSPNNRKIEADKPLLPEQEEGPGETLGREVLLAQPMLEAMGRELASVHLATEGAAAAVRRDFLAREPAWWAKAASTAAEHVQREQRQFATA